MHALYATLIVLALTIAVFTTGAMAQCTSGSTSTAATSSYSNNLAGTLADHQTYGDQNNFIRLWPIALTNDQVGSDFSSVTFYLKSDYLSHPTVNYALVVYAFSSGGTTATLVASSSNQQYNDQFSNSVQGPLTVSLTSAMTITQANVDNGLLVGFVSDGTVPTIFSFSNAQDSDTFYKPSGYTYSSSGTPPSSIAILTGSGDHDVPFSVALTCPSTLAAVPTALSSGDPQLVGFRGQSFQVHGIDGSVYNMMSSETMQLNSRFTFLSQGRCPTVSDVAVGSQAHLNCYSHPGSYCSAFGLQVRMASASPADTATPTRIILESGSASGGFARVSINDRALVVGAYVYSANTHVNISYVTSHFVTIDTDLFALQYDNSDAFINQRIQLKQSLTHLEAINLHGLLGQTWNTKIYGSSSIKYIQGEVDDYRIAEEDLFGKEFMYNQW